MAVDESIRELIASEEQSLNRPCEVVDAVVLGSGPTAVAVALYRGEMESPRPDMGKMIEWRLAALTKQRSQRVTSVIVHTAWED